RRSNFLSLWSPQGRSLRGTRYFSFSRFSQRLGAFIQADGLRAENLTLESMKCSAGRVSSKHEPSLSPGAIARLVEAHREFLAFLERRVESRAVAEDILQAAFVRGLERGAGVQGEKVVAWFYRVLRNSLIDHYRRRSSSARAMDAWVREFAENQR